MHNDDNDVVCGLFAQRCLLRTFFHTYEDRSFRFLKYIHVGGMCGNYRPSFVNIGIERAYTLTSLKNHDNLN